MVGSGIEYVHSRLYQPGDPIKSIDWRITARTRKVHVKEYEVPGVPVYLLIDTSASMTIASTTMSKYESAVYVAGGLALACLERISPVGVLSVGGQRLHVQPSLSKDQILEWLYRLRHFHYDQPTEPASHIAELSPSLHHRTMIIVLSDLHDPEALPLLKRLGQRHDCIVLQFRDPAERSRGAGFLCSPKAETGRPIVARGRTSWLDQASIAAQLRPRGDRSPGHRYRRALCPSPAPFFPGPRHLGTRSPLENAPSCTPHYARNGFRAR